MSKTLSFSDHENDFEEDKSIEKKDTQEIKHISENENKNGNEKGRKRNFKTFLFEPDDRKYFFVILYGPN